MTSQYFNDKGEPLMTDAQARLADELDEMSRHERQEDDERNYP